MYVNYLYFSGQSLVMCVTRFLSTLNYFWKLPYLFTIYLPTSEKWMEAELLLVSTYMLCKLYHWAAPSASTKGEKQKLRHLNFKNPAVMVRLTDQYQNCVVWGYHPILLLKFALCEDTIKLDIHGFFSARICYKLKHFFLKGKSLWRCKPIILPFWFFCYSFLFFSIFLIYCEAYWFIWALFLGWYLLGSDVNMLVLPARPQFWPYKEK